MLVTYIFGVPNTIALGLSVINITFYFGNSLSYVMFSSRYDTTISLGHFLYGMIWKAHLVFYLTVCVILSTYTHFSSAPTIFTCTCINAFHTASNSLSPTTISMLIWRSVNTDMVVFRLFYASVSPRPCIFIIKMNLILNYSVTRKMLKCTNMKYNPICSFLWWSGSRLVSVIISTFCTCCGIFRTIFFFNMATLGPYMDSALLIWSR